MTEKTKAQKVNFQSHLDSRWRRLHLTRCDVSKTQICPDRSAKILQRMITADPSPKPETPARHSGPSLTYLPTASLRPIPASSSSHLWPAPCTSSPRSSPCPQTQARVPCSWTLHLLVPPLVPFLAALFLLALHYSIPPTAPS